MNRIGAGLVAVVLSVTLGATASSAQTYPDPNRPDAVGSGSCVPGGAGNLTVTGAAPGAEEPGTITNTTPIPVNDTADASGVLEYSFSCPADFTLNASHALVFANGGSLTFCVNSSGAVVPCSTLTPPTTSPPAALPRTGADYVDDGLRTAAVAIAGGALLVLWRRRRTGTIASG